MKPHTLGPILVTLLVSVSSGAWAFVSSPVGGQKGELDINGQLTLERGKYEPNENQASFRKMRSWYEYKLGVGYTWGDAGPLQFFSTRLEATYYRTPAETNDPSAWQIGPAGSSAPGTIGPECTAGAKYLGNGVCEFYPEDQGTLVTATVSFDVVHQPNYALGFFLRSTVPIAMDLDKFANPRVDYIVGGMQVGARFTSWLSAESTFFIGSGTRPFGKEQNGAAALSTLLHFQAERWLLPWQAGFKLGPYVEGDIHERFDERYDRAYSPQVLGQPTVAGPQQFRDRIRAARFALALLPYFLVTDDLAVEGGYIQKFFGYDARATQAYFVGLRGRIGIVE